MKKTVNHPLLNRIRATSPEKLQAAKQRLLSCAAGADAKVGACMPKYTEALEKIDTEPELLLNCDRVLMMAVEYALDEVERGTDL
jgi:hypothetical protein